MTGERPHLYLRRGLFYSHRWGLTFRALLYIISNRCLFNQNPTTIYGLFSTRVLNFLSALLSNASWFTLNNSETLRTFLTFTSKENRSISTLEEVSRDFGGDSVEVTLWHFQDLPQTLSILDIWCPSSLPSMPHISISRFTTIISFWQIPPACFWLLSGGPTYWWWKVPVEGTYSGRVTEIPWRKCQGIQWMNFCNCKLELFWLLQDIIACGFDPEKTFMFSNFDYMG